MSTTTVESMPMTTQEQPLLIDERNGVAWLTMNRPERLNALNAGLTDALRNYFQALDLKDRTGAAPRDVQQGFAGQKSIRDIMIAMRECPQPIISIVQGSASGGGLGIALASDIRLCTPEARFNAAFIKIGVSGCDMGSSYFLPRMVGASLATTSTRPACGRPLRWKTATRCCAPGAVISTKASAPFLKSGGQSTAKPNEPRQQTQAHHGQACHAEPPQPQPHPPPTGLGLDGGRRSVRSARPGPGPERAIPQPPGAPGGAVPARWAG